MTAIELQMRNKLSGSISEWYLLEYQTKAQDLRNLHPRIKPLPTVKSRRPAWKVKLEKRPDLHRYLIIAVSKKITYSLHQALHKMSYTDLCKMYLTQKKTSIKYLSLILQVMRILMGFNCNTVELMVYGPNKTYVLRVPR